MHTLEYTRTRFYVDQKVYEGLVAKPTSPLIIHVEPRKGKHHRGVYTIPNQTAREFIEKKQKSPNWELHANFHQDSVPRALRPHFDEKADAKPIYSSTY